jgi:hypothetical protein
MRGLRASGSQGFGADGAEREAAAGGDGEGGELVVGGVWAEGPACVGWFDEEGAGFAVDGASVGRKRGRDFDAEGAAWADEGSVLQGADFGEDDALGAERACVSAGPEAGGLDHALERHDTWEDGEAGEVIAQVFFGAADVLEGEHARGGESEGAIEEGEVHGRELYEGGAKKGRLRNARFVRLGRGCCAPGGFGVLIMRRLKWPLRGLRVAGEVKALETWSGVLA